MNAIKKKKWSQKDIKITSGSQLSTTIEPDTRLVELERQIQFFVTIKKLLENLQSAILSFNQATLD